MKLNEGTKVYEKLINDCILYSIVEDGYMNIIEEYFLDLKIFTRI